ncbi:MAG: hypothetical protein P8N50_12850, partial [Actinomycetota bacterium]|nr:hypothetical protein [Actinomycetota bacterium]
PRARGRATRINKRTCHITVIVARLDDEELEAREASGLQAARTGGSDRRARVAASRATDGAEGEEITDDTVEDIEDDLVDDTVSDDTVSEDTAETEEVEVVPDDAGAAQPFGEGSAAPLEDDSAPEGFTIKGNADSMKYHEPGGRWYQSTVAEVWFNSVEAAEAAGFIKAGTRAKPAIDSDAEGEA